VPYAVAYALLLPDQVSNAIRELQLDVRARYGANTDLRHPPHITVKAPFDAGDLDAHMRYVDAVARGSAPFDIELDGIDFFDDPQPVAFVNVAMPNAGLARLTDTIRRDLGAEARPSPYEAANTVRYHATISPLDADALARARRDYAAVRPRFRFRAERLALFVGFGDGEWTVLRVAALGGPGPLVSR
jgi:2'-5' RNA ligase